MDETNNLYLEDSANRILDMLADYFAVDPETIIRSGAHDHVFMRGVFLVECDRVLAPTRANLAEVVGLHPSNVSLIIRRHQARRDAEPRFSVNHEKAAEAIRDLTNALVSVRENADLVRRVIAAERAEMLAHEEARLAGKIKRSSELKKAKAERKRLASQLVSAPVKRERGCPNKSRLAKHILSVMPGVIGVPASDLKLRTRAQAISLYLSSCLSSCQIEELAALHHTSVSNAQVAIDRIRKETWQDAEFNERVNAWIVEAAPKVNVYLEPSYRKPDKYYETAVQGELL